MNDDKNKNPLPASKNKELTKSQGSLPEVADPLTSYVRQISRYPLLSQEEEKELAYALKETGDLEAAKKLVTHNLRLVVKIALEYKTAWQNVMDLIQEGNIGLMKAVSKYDPDKGTKLSSYAAWWIRSYVLKFILDNFRLVKIGTTNEQKKLFYNLLKEKNRLTSLGQEANSKAIAANLGVSEKTVVTMDARMSAPGGSEISLDSSGPDGGETLGEGLSDDEQKSAEEVLGESQGMKIMQDHLTEFLNSLDERDRDIFKKRLLSEIPPSLQSIADQYHVSRERIRQIEARLVKNLKVYMAEHIR